MPKVNHLATLATVVVVVGIGLWLRGSAKPTSAVASPSQVAQSANSSTPASSTSTYSLADVSKHKTANDCWTAIGGSVYNLTEFIPQHPGGEQIVQACGIDATSLFDSQPGHSRRQAQNDLAQLQIGSLTK